LTLIVTITTVLHANVLYCDLPNYTRTIQMQNVKYNNSPSFALK